MADIAGYASVTVDGRAYLVAGEGSWRPSGNSRESMNGQDGYHGTKRMPMPGKMSWKFRDDGTVPVSALSEAVDATVVFQLANGKIIIGRNMSRVGDAPIEVATEDSTATVDFEGPDVSEQL